MKDVFKRMVSLFPARLLAGAAIVTAAIVLPVASMAADAVKIEGSLGVANVTAGDTKYAKSVNAKYDQVVKLQVYYHNQENPDSGKVANNLRVKINIPTAKGQVQNVSAKISADNSNTINDNVTVNLDRADAYLEYIPGSAVWKHNKGTNENVQFVEEKISDEVVYGGQGLVVENAKPCFNFEATITVLARVRVPGITVDKTVRVKGTTEWSTSNTAKPGETLEYQIAYKNMGNTQHKNVVIRDNLPPKMQYVPGSTKLKNSGGVKSVPDGVVAGGIIVGNYNPGAAAYVLFEVKVPTEDKLACGETVFRNVGVARPEGMNEFYNTATTRVNKVCKEQPVFDCEDVTVAKLGNRKIRVSVDTTATNGATVKSYTYDFGDGSTPLVTDKNPVEYTYAKDGNFNVRVKVTFDVNGETKVVDSDKCVGEVNFETPETPETPVTPGKTLPNTGAGEVIGVFGAVTIAGAVWHRLFWSRRFSN